MVNTSRLSYKDYQAYKKEKEDIEEELFQAVKHKQVLICWSQYWTWNGNSERWRGVQNELKEAYQKIEDIKVKLDALKTVYKMAV